MTVAPSGVLFVGALTLDTLYRVEDFTRGPGKYLSEDCQTMASGMASNAATAAARLGGKVSLWAAVGGDSFGSALIEEIAGEGVDCTHVRRVPEGRSASATIIVDKSGERWVLVDYDPVTQAPPPENKRPPVEKYAAVMVDVRWPGAARMALDHARRAGRYGILDADVAPPEILKALAADATHIVASEQGATLLSGQREPKNAASAIAGEYGCFVCVTLGANGSVWTDADGSCVGHIPNPRVDVVDTNSAGDVFHGAFALALAEGQSPTDSIQFASAAAALSCTVFGGRLGAPDREKTLQLLKATY